MTAPTKRAMDAATVLARQRVDQRVAAGENIPNPGGLARIIAQQDLWPDHHETLTACAIEHPDWSVEELARQVDLDPVTGPSDAASSADSPWRSMEEQSRLRFEEASNWVPPDEAERSRSRSFISEARARLRADDGVEDITMRTA